MTFKMGDKVRQVKSGPYQARVSGLVGTVVYVDEEENYPVAVNFPQIDGGIWPFGFSEVELVDEEDRA